MIMRKKNSHNQIDIGASYIWLRANFFLIRLADMYLQSLVWLHRAFGFSLLRRMDHSSNQFLRRCTAVHHRAAPAALQG